VESLFHAAEIGLACHVYFGPISAYQDPILVASLDMLDDNRDSSQGSVP
jgi:hypothetical protein